MHDPNGTAAKLSTERLAAGYNGSAVVSDITLSLGRGEILSLIGPNGAGKTTVLKSITRHLEPIAGIVYLDEQDMRHMSGREIARKLAAVFTDRANPEHMTCFEMAAAGRYPYTGSFGLLTARDREIVSDALAMVRADDIADRDISEISDGQRQRVMLARAICQEPEVIVLDEPTSYLDIKHKLELLGILRSMAKENGVTVIMSLHEIDLAQKISDRLVCVKNGRITAYGRPDEIFTAENISALYGLENSSFDTLSGSVELAPPRGEPRCFVIGGCGRGVSYYRALARSGVPFSAGILFGNDMDCTVALALSQNVIVSEPFEPIPGQLVTEAKKLIDAADTVIDSGCPVGEYNRVSELLEYARLRGKRIISSHEELSEAVL